MLRREIKQGRGRGCVCKCKEVWGGEAAGEVTFEERPKWVREEAVWVPGRQGPRRGEAAKTLRQDIFGAFEEW